MSEITPTCSSIPTLAAKASSLDQAPVAIFWIDPSGHISYVNDQLCHLSGYSSELLINQPIDKLISSVNTCSWHNEWWPILKRDHSMSTLAMLLGHSEGIKIECNLSASLVTIADNTFATLYLWPQENTTTIRHNSSTHLLEKLNECVSLLDKTAIVQYANPALCHKLNVSSNDLIGHSLFDFLIPTQFQLQDVWQAIQQDTSSKIELQCQNKLGKEFVLRMHVVPEQNQLLLSFVDITEQYRIANELKEKNASLEHLATNIPGFIYKFKMTADGDFSFPYASMGCQDIFGVAPAEVVNDATPIIDTIHSDDVQMFFDSVLTSASQLSPWNHEARSSTVDNEWKWFHAASKPELQKNGDVIWEGLVMDVTDRKKAEGELAKAKEKAEALAATKTAFLFNMSHEIRTPLNAVIGLTRLALDTGLTSVQHQYISKVLSSSKVLLGIVNNVLDFSKIESGKLQIEHIEFSLSSILENVGIILEAKAAEKGLELLIDNYSKDYENLIGDPLRLEQVLINFCNNAITFTDHGEILISVQPLEENNESIKLKFMVKDTGIGLTEQQQQKIFESFTQADNSTTRKYGGTGLGLTICKQIVAILGGEIGIESEANKGSTFYFTATLTKAVKPMGQKVFLSSETKKKQLLIIDENVKSSELLIQTLTSSGLQVTAVNSAMDALQNLRQSIKDFSFQGYDLIILDWKVSVSNDVNIINQIKQIPDYKNTPLLMMISTYASDHFKKLNNDNQIHSFINKPFIKTKLLTVIKDTLADKKDPAIEQTDINLVSIENLDKLLNGSRVLLAEDNVINQEIAHKILQSKGIDVLIVNNGHEAVDYLLANEKTITIDAIFMDLQMPEMDGFEASRIIRTHPVFDSLPIIAMTAHVFDAEKEKCIAAGMQFHICKPIEPTVLFNTLANAIGPKKQQSNPSPLKPEVLDSNKPSVLTGFSSVDINAAKKMLNGDELFLKKLLQKFALEQAAIITEMKQKINLHDYAQAADLAHNIKGVAGNLHINKVFASAKKLEKVLTHKALQKLPALLSQLENDFNQFTHELNQLNSQPIVKAINNQAKTNDVIISTDMLKLLDSLIVYLDSNNFKAQSCLEELSPFLSQYCQNELKQFSQLIINLDFTAAAIIAKTLKKQLSESCPQ